MFREMAIQMQKEVGKELRKEVGVSEITNSSEKIEK